MVEPDSWTPKRRTSAPCIEDRTLHRELGMVRACVCLGVGGWVFCVGHGFMWVGCVWVGGWVPGGWVGVLCGWVGGRVH
jgi:hypothetical protein